MKERVKRSFNILLYSTIFVATFFAYLDMLSFQRMFFYIVSMSLLILGYFATQIKNSIVVNIKKNTVTKNHKFEESEYKFIGMVWFWPSIIMIILVFVLPKNSLVGCFYIYLCITVLIPIFYLLNLRFKKKKKDNENSIE